MTFSSLEMKLHFFIFLCLHMCVFLHCLISDVNLLEFWSPLYAKECSTKESLLLWKTCQGHCVPSLQWNADFPLEGKSIISKGWIGCALKKSSCLNLGHWKASNTKMFPGSQAFSFDYVLGSFSFSLQSCLLELCPKIVYKSFKQVRPNSDASFA